MADNQSYADVAVLKGLFESASAGDAMAMEELADILTAAELQNKNDWREKISKTWREGVASIVAGMNADALRPEDIKLLKVMMKFVFDGEVIRPFYCGMIRSIFAGSQNIVGLCDAIGCDNFKNSLNKIAGRIASMDFAKVGTVCFDLTSGIGEVVAVDEVNSEVTVAAQRRRTLSLQQFIDAMYMVKPGSPLADIIAGTAEGQFANSVEFSREMQNSVVSVQPFTLATLKKVLVPAKMSEKAFSEMSNGGESAKAKAMAVSAEGAVDASAWDESRSLDELIKRLDPNNDGKMNLANFKKENPNLDNIKNLLSNDAASPKFAENFTKAVAMLYKGGEYNDFLCGVLQEIAERVYSWSNPAAFIEISDKMPGKLVPFWFRATKEIMGSEWLTDNTLKMPYRLWENVQKLLDKTSEEDMLANKVYECFKAGKVNADMYFWMWKKAPKNDLRRKYMSDSYLLFSVLRQDVKGSYLKSRSMLIHLLMDDEVFQRTVMGEGDEKAIQALTHCVKHLPLLDIDERQAMLVKIVRIYGESALKFVEERQVGPLKRDFGRITSLRGYFNAEMELKDLVEVQIPENTAAIGHARSLGDLRENSEYKYAKERQRALNSRRGELEGILSSTRTIKFADININNVVEPGCRVTLKYEDGKLETFVLLGLLDGAPEKNIVSYATELGKALLEKEVGDEVTLPAGDEVVIDAINPLEPEMIAWLDSVEQ